MAVRVIVVNLARISGNKTHYYRIMLVTSNAVVSGAVSIVLVGRDSLNNVLQIPTRTSFFFPYLLTAIVDVEIE